MILPYGLTRKPGTISNHEKYTTPQIFWELNWLSQRDPKLIQFIKKNILIPPPRVKQPLQLLQPFDERKPWKHQGTHGEALAVESVYGLNRKKKIRSNETTKMGDANKRNGFFIEAGAFDGEIKSNTLYFEIRYNWTGLLVEPNPILASMLVKKQRNAWILPYCLSVIEAPVVVEFDAAGNLGGIINVEKNGKRKFPGNMAKPGWLGPIWRKTIQVQCFPLYSVLAALDFPKIDYFSLDIEGAEFQVLKTIPFHLQELKIMLMGIETVHAGKIFNGTEEDIKGLMTSNNYKFIAQTRLDTFYLKQKRNWKNNRKGIIRVSPDFYKLNYQVHSQIA